MAAYTHRTVTTVRYEWRVPTNQFGAAWADVNTGDIVIWFEVVEKEW